MTSAEWGPHLPGPQVVEQMVANLGLLLIELGEKVQKQREAAVVFLHLAQIPGSGEWRMLGLHHRHTLTGSFGAGMHCLCPLQGPSFLIPAVGQECTCAGWRLPEYQVEGLPH